MFQCVQTHSEPPVCPLCNWDFFLTGREGLEDTTSAKKHLTSRFLAYNPPRRTHTATHTSVEIKALSERKGFVQANTSTDVSMLLDFLWDRLCALVL